MHLTVDNPAEADAWYTKEMTSTKFEDAPRASAALAVNHHRCLFELGRLNELDPRWRGGWSPAIADRLGTDPTVARTEMQQLLAELRAGGDRWTLLWHLHLSASALRMLGLLDDAQAVLDEAATIASDADAIVQQVPIRCELALLSPTSGREHVTAAQQLIGDGRRFGLLGARVALADAVVTAADGGGADGLFTHAVETLQRGGRVWHLADAYRQWGRALAAKGDRENADLKFAAAADVYRRIDAAAHWAHRLHP
jgi:tetratricopeptide (TPR) repeat protein